MEIHAYWSHSGACITSVSNVITMKPTAWLWTRFHKHKDISKTVQDRAQFMEADILQSPETTEAAWFMSLHAVFIVLFGQETGPMNVQHWMVHFTCAVCASARAPPGMSHIGNSSCWKRNPKCSVAGWGDLVGVSISCVVNTPLPHVPAPSWGLQGDKTSAKQKSWTWF